MVCKLKCKETAENLEAETGAPAGSVKGLSIARLRISQWSTEKKIAEAETSHDPDVLDVLATLKGANSPYLSMLIAANPHTAPETLVKIYDNCHESEYQATIKALASNSNLPDAVCSKLETDSYAFLWLARQYDKSGKSLEPFKEAALQNAFIAELFIDSENITSELAYEMALAGGKEFLGAKALTGNQLSSLYELKGPQIANSVLTKQPRSKLDDELLKKICNDAYSLEDNRYKKAAVRGLCSTDNLPETVLSELVKTENPNRLKELLRSTQSYTPSQQQSFLNNPNDEIRQQAWANSQVAGEQSMRDNVQSDDDFVLKGIVGNQNVPEDAINQILGESDFDSQLWAAAMNNEKLEPSTMIILENMVGGSALNLVTRENCPFELVDLVCQEVLDNIDNVDPFGVDGNQRVAFEKTVNSEIIEMAINSESDPLNEVVAGNRSLTDAQIETMFGSDSPDVRTRVMEREYLPEDVLRSGLIDLDPYVRSAAIRNLRTGIPEIIEVFNTELDERVLSAISDRFGLS